MSRNSAVLILLASGCLLPCFPGLFSFADPPSGSRPSQFGADRVDPSEPVTIATKRALGYLEKICAIGPRVSGTAGMTRQQELLRDHFAKFDAKVQMQLFTARQVTVKQPVEMGNLIVSWHPERQRRVILCSHYDTRPIADQERDKRKWREPFLSANDGGSGVAFLMELAHHMKNLKTRVGVDFVFFDGEEYIHDANRDQYFFGSRHFAQAWLKAGRRPTYIAAILLDMIAGPNPRFPAEGYSYGRARDLVVEIWGIARELRCTAFQDRVGAHVQDDHLALLNAGIFAIDIIDFDYPHWHRLSDTPENCAPEGLEQVGKVLTLWLQRIR